MASSLEQRLPEREIRAAELTVGDWMRLWWGFVWRGFVYSLTSLAAAGAIGYVVGLPGIAARTPLAVQFAVGGMFGLVTAIVFFTVYLRWLLRARFGSMRIALLGAV